MHLMTSNSNTCAQKNESGTVRGTVIDESTSRPLESVNILLRRKSDSTTVTGIATDKTGKIELNNIPPGEYFITFTLIGYKEKNTKVFRIDRQHRRLNLDIVSLIPEAVIMNEVEVTEEKALFNYSLGKKVYNVDEDVMAKSASASEVLQNIPSVQVDIDGKVSLRGSTKILILLDGKTSPLMDKNSEGFLEQLPANSIEKVEVITNPSAKYKTEGRAGIINIVLKKNTALGINGNATLHGGNEGRYNGNIRLNNNPGDVNLFGSYGFRRDDHNHFTLDTRTLPVATSSTSRSLNFNENLFIYEHPRSQTAGLGVDYHPDAGNSAGISGNYYHDYFTVVDTLQNVFENTDNVVLRRFDRGRSGFENEKEYGFTTYAEHGFGSDLHTLRMDITSAWSPKKVVSRFTNLFIIPPNPPRYDNSSTEQDDRRTQVSVDYSNPLSESASLEAGYAGEFNSVDLDHRSELFDATVQQFVNDTTKSNEFLFHESLNALYTTFKQVVGKFSFLGGLRAEEVSRTANSVTLDSVVGRNYFNLYPTLTGAYKFNQELEVQLSYSRRTSRPKAKDLNPFPEFRDARTVFLGNPFLLPEYIHSLELGCNIQGARVSFLPSVFYRYTYNRLTSLKQGNNRFILQTTWENFSNDEALGAELVVSVSAGKFFSAHTGLTGYYDQINAPDIDYLTNRVLRSWGNTLTCNFRFSKASRLQLSSHYTSARLTAQGRYSPNYVLNLGARHEMLDGRLSINLTASDILKTRKREIDLDIPGLHELVTTTRDSRVLYIGFTYRLDVPPKKAKEEQWHYEEEKEEDE